MLVLEDGSVAFGDCAAVQYSGCGGRDPLFLAGDYISVIEKYGRPLLGGRGADSFRALAAEVEAVRADGRPLHTAVRYGVTQAILDAVAHSKHRLMCEVVAEEYGTDVSDRMIPIFTQSGDNRYDNADKMILKGADVLPHALINNLDAKLGRHGEKLMEYVAWLRERILKLRAREGYRPVIHLDVYGTIGALFGNERFCEMADYLEKLARAASTFRLRVEGPMDADERERQMADMRLLREEVDRRGIPVELVADEWCNTLQDVKDFADNRAGHMLQIKTPDLGGIQNTAEAVLYCREKASAPTRAAPATKPTAPPRCACT
jgi:methylaspartate ammonia-lyase